MLKIVQRNKDSQLDLTGGSRLASRQKLHTCQACQKLKRHVSWSNTRQKVETGHSVTSWLELATQSSRESKPPANSVLKNLTLHIPFSPQYKYPLYPRNIESFQRDFFREKPQRFFQRETLEKNKIDSSTIFTQRLFKFLYSLPLHCEILERFITNTFSHHTHIYEKAIWCFGKQLRRNQFHIGRCYSQVAESEIGRAHV